MKQIELFENHYADACNVTLHSTWNILMAN